MSIKIVTDSGCDLPANLIKQLDIAVMPLYVFFGTDVYRDGVDISHDEFYKRLVEGSLHPTTSQPSPSDFASLYSELGKKHDEIVSIHLSSDVSGTYQSAYKGAETADTKAKIRVIDSRSISLGMGLMVAAAARAVQAGAGLKEVMQEMKNSAEELHILALLDTLKYVLIGGRIGKARALLGTVLNVKPLITIKDGQVSPAGQVRTRAKAVERLIEFARGIKNVQDCAVAYNTTPEEGTKLKEAVSDFITSCPVHMSRFGPAIGTHGGPGMLGVVLRAKSV